MSTTLNDCRVIVPVWADDDALARLLPDLRDRGLRCLVADGQGSSATAALAAHHGAEYVSSPRGRGLQVAAGIQACTETWIWVVHADSRLSEAAVAALAQLSAAGEPRWGRFDVTVEGLGLISWSMNLRSRLTRICTGDQCMFFHRRLLDAVGGFPAIPLMEDIEVSRHLKRHASSAFRALDARVTTSSRRWRRRGVLRTVLAMWGFRLRYFLGADPEVLFQRYYGAPR